VQSRSSEEAPRIDYDRVMAANGARRSNPRIMSEPRGPHWVAWIADAAGKPEGSVVLVGESQEEAEERARKWAEQTARE
jgi:hypothetical protein